MPDPVKVQRFGLDDYESGIDMKSFKVTASVEVNGTRGGESLAPPFRHGAEGIWELPLQRPLPGAGTVCLEVAGRER
jgi:hypothetical protein